jgi:hypothetical protein
MLSFIRRLLSRNKPLPLVIPAPPTLADRYKEFCKNREALAQAALDLMRQQQEKAVSIREEIIAIVKAETALSLESTIDTTWIENHGYRVQFTLCNSLVAHIWIKFNEGTATTDDETTHGLPTWIDRIIKGANAVAKNLGMAGEA